MEWKTLTNFINSCNMVDLLAALRVIDLDGRIEARGRIFSEYYKIDI